jgi:hypothetical protein
MSSEDRPSALSMNGVRGFDSSLGVELGGIGYFEEHVLHDIRAIGHLELERLALAGGYPCQNVTSNKSRRGSYLEQDVIEAPGLCGKHRREAELALLDEEGEVDRTRARVARSPGLARAGVGRMAVRSEGLTVDERLRDRVDSLLMGEPTIMR